MDLPAAAGTEGFTCTPETCHPACALEVIDDLLRASAAAHASEVDALLEFRWLVHRRQDAEAVVGLFCQLRRNMEERHYLNFYRLRRWLENQIEASIRLRRGDPERIVPLSLERYCIQAVRYHCLERVRENGEPLLSPRVSFSFRRRTKPVLGLLPSGQPAP